MIEAENQLVLTGLVNGHGGPNPAAPQGHVAQQHVLSLREGQNPAGRQTALGKEGVLLCRIRSHSLQIIRFTLPGKGQKVAADRVSLLVGGPLVHVIGVGLDLYQTGVGHLLDLRLAEMGRQGIGRVLVVLCMPDRAANHKNGCLHAVLSKDREGSRVVAQISVVKGDQHGLFRQRDPLVHKVQDLGGAYRMEALLLQQKHLPFKGVGVQNGVALLRLVVKMVVGQDGQSNRRQGRPGCEQHVLGGVCLPGGAVRSPGSRDSGGVALHPAQQQICGVAAQMGSVVEKAFVIAQRADLEIPEGPVLGQGSVGIGQSRCVDAGQQLAAGGTQNHGKRCACFGAEASDLPDRLQTDLGVDRRSCLRRKELGMVFQIGVQRADGFRVLPGSVRQTVGQVGLGGIQLRGGAAGQIEQIQNQHQPLQRFPLHQGFRQLRVLRRPCVFSGKIVEAASKAVIKGCRTKRGGPAAADHIGFIGPRLRDRLLCRVGGRLPAAAPQQKKPGRRQYSRQTESGQEITVFLRKRPSSGSPVHGASGP